MVTINDLALRVRYCQQNNLCFISLKPLTEGGAIVWHSWLQLDVVVHPKYVS